MNTFSYLSLHVKDVPVFFSCYVLHATIVQNARKSDASTDESDLYLLPPARERGGSDLYLLPPARERGGREKRDDRERERESRGKDGRYLILQKGSLLKFETRIGFDDVDRPSQQIRLIPGIKSKCL